MFYFQLKYVPLLPVIFSYFDGSLSHCGRGLGLCLKDDFDVLLRFKPLSYWEVVEIFLGIVPGKYSVRLRAYNCNSCTCVATVLAVWGRVFLYNRNGLALSLKLRSYYIISSNCWQYILAVIVKPVKVNITCTKPPNRYHKILQLHIRFRMISYRFCCSYFVAAVHWCEDLRLSLRIHFRQKLPFDAKMGHL